MSESKKQLFFLPFAGANLNSYNPITQILREDYECHVVELPGHGSRYGEPLLERIESMVSFCSDEIMSKRNDEPWGIFGHSLGAVLASLICDSDRFRIDSPEWIILSGRSGPGISVSNMIRHQLSREDLLKDVTKMGGIQQELLKHPELLDLMVPILRADFRAIETYDYTTVPQLHVPVLVLGGTTDSIREDQLKAWKSVTSDKCQVKMVEGGHFFILQNVSEVVSLIREMSKLTL